MSLIAKKLRMLEPTWLASRGLQPGERLSPTLQWAHRGFQRQPGWSDIVHAGWQADAGAVQKQVSLFADGTVVETPALCATDDAENPGPRLVAPARPRGLDPLNAWFQDLTFASMAPLRHRLQSIVYTYPFPWTGTAPIGMNAHYFNQHCTRLQQLAPAASFPQFLFEARRFLSNPALLRGTDPVITWAQSLITKIDRPLTPLSVEHDQQALLTRALRILITSYLSNREYQYLRDVPEHQRIQTVQHLLDLKLTMMKGVRAGAIDPVAVQQLHQLSIADRVTMGAGASAIDSNRGPAYIRQRIQAYLQQPGPAAPGRIDIDGVDAATYEDTRHAFVAAYDTSLATMPQDLAVRLSNRRLHQSRLVLMNEDSTQPTDGLDSRIDSVHIELDLMFGGIVLEYWITQALQVQFARLGWAWTDANAPVTAADFFQTTLNPTNTQAIAARAHDDPHTRLREMILYSDADYTSGSPRRRLGPISVYELARVILAGRPDAIEELERNLLRLARTSADPVVLFFVINQVFGTQGTAAPQVTKDADSMFALRWELQLHRDWRRRRLPGYLIDHSQEMLLREMQRRSGGDA